MANQEVAVEAAEPKPAAVLGRTGRTLWHTAVYMAGLVTSRGGMFLLLPVITRTIEPAQYAMYDLCRMGLFFLNPFLNLGLQSAVVRYLFHYDTPAGQRKLYSTSLFFLLCIILPVVSMLFYFSDDLAGLLFKSPGHGNLVRLTVLVSAATALSQQPLTLLRAHEKSVTYSVLQLLRGVAGPGSIFLLLVWFKWGLPGILWGEMFGLAALAGAGLAVSYKWLVLSFDARMLKPLLKFGLPLLPVGIGGALLTVSDRYVLSRYLTLEEMAPYSLGFTVGMCLSLLIQALQLSWLPAALNLSKTGGKGTIAKSLLMLQLLLFTLAMVVSALAPEVIWIFAPEKGYVGAELIVPWIAFSYALHGTVTLLSASFGIAAQTGWVAGIFCVAGGSKVLMSLLFIPRYGIFGAAVTTFAAFGVELVLTYVLAQRVYPLPLEGKRFAGSYLLTGLGFSGIVAGLLMPGGFSLGTRLLVLGGFCFSSYYFLLTASDRKAIWSTVDSQGSRLIASLRRT